MRPIFVTMLVVMVEVIEVCCMQQLFYTVQLFIPSDLYVYTCHHFMLATNVAEEANKGRKVIRKG